MRSTLRDGPPGPGCSTRPWPPCDFPFEGKTLTSAEIINRLTDREPAARREAAKSLGQVLGENKRVFSLITNTLAKDKEIEDGWRSFPRPVSARNLGNFVEDEVVDALVGAVHRAYPKLSHRYYRLKAKWFGVDALPYWDRNAPLPEDDDRLIPWRDAQQLVLGAYAKFSPDLAEIGQRFFDQAWIDAPVRPGKAPGAFAHPTVPSAHPYLLLNYQGRTRDVMTLAHELGHGVHQVLAGPQGHLMAETPLTLAETASVFGEMLTFQAMLAAETAPQRRKIMLASKVEDMLNTVVRQIAMHEFETLCTTSGAAANCCRSGSARSGCRPRRPAWAPRSNSMRTTATSGPTFRISSMCRSTSTPMPSATAW